MVKTYHYLKILFAVILLAMTNTGFAALKAHVDRNTVYMGDSIQLTVHAGDSAKSLQPDISALQKNFDILSTGKSSQVLISNGKSFTDALWIFVLTPKKTGTQTIPAVTIGNQKTVAITIDVKPASKDSTLHPNKRHVFMTASLTPQSPYVQSQAMYTLKIYYNRQIENPQLSEPKSVNATFVHLGNDRTYQENINGQSYQVLEVHFAMFPQQSGKVSIDGSIFNGNILNKNPGQYFSNAWQAFRISANSLKTTVKPIPTNANTKWWLPAKSVTLSDNWSANPEQIQAGTPITRTVTINAENVLANQLPEVIPNKLDGFQIYADKPTSKTTTTGTQLNAVRVEKAAFIANKPGNYTLPAVTVHWWNTDKNQPEVSTLPAKKIHVIPGVATTTNTPTMLSAPSISPSDNNVNISAPVNMIAKTSQRFWQDKWFWLASAFLLVWLMTLVAIVWFKKQKLKMQHQVSTQEKDKHIGSIRAARSAVKAAVQENDYAAFQKALIFLAQETWLHKNFLSLGDVIDCIDDEAAKSALHELNKHLYHSDVTVTDCKQIWRAVEKSFILKKKSDNDDEPLPSLY